MFLKMQNMFFWERLRIFRGKKTFFLKSGIDTFLPNLACFLPLRQRFFMAMGWNRCTAFPAMITRQLNQIWRNASEKNTYFFQYSIILKYAL